MEFIIKTDIYVSSVSFNELFGHFNFGIEKKQTKKLLAWLLSFIIFLYFSLSVKFYSMRLSVIKINTEQSYTIRCRFYLKNDLEDRKNELKIKQKPQNKISCISFKIPTLWAYFALLFCVSCKSGTFGCPNVCWVDKWMKGSEKSDMPVVMGIWETVMSTQGEKCWFTYCVVVWKHEIKRDSQYYVE